MKYNTALLILSIVIIACILSIIISILYKWYIRRLREETSEYLFGSKQEDCKSIPHSHSQGLILDSAIVCNVMKSFKNFKNQPIFYYEQYPSDADPNGYFFVNLDHTDFEKLIHDSNSPKKILCKNKQTYHILSNRLKDKLIIYTGFTSIDRFDPSIHNKNKYRSYIHIAGKSAYKGTLPLVQTWLKHPEWPKLTLICRIPWKLGINTYGSKNIDLIDGFISEKELTSYINKNGIHICPSKHEGFGHYINEARSTESVVLYTNAPPMNEFFINGVNGIGISASESDPINKGYCPVYLVNQQSIEEAVHKTLDMSEDELYNMGKQARKGFIRDDQLFKERLLNML
jgi:hypothetical protein